MAPVRSVLLLAVLLPLSPAVAQVLPGAAEPARADGFSALDLALSTLEVAHAQHNDPELWSDVRVTADDALAALAEARTAGAPADVCGAAHATLEALVRRQDEIERQAYREDGGWDTAALQRVAAQLASVEGRLPVTSVLLAETLFLLEDDDRGQATLARALVLWPGDERVHESVRVWQDVLPRPRELAEALGARVERVGDLRGGASGLLAETAGQLLMTAARARYEQGLQDGDEAAFADAAAGFDAADRALVRSLGLSARMASDAVAAMRGDALLNACYSHLGRAKVLWRADPQDAERAPAAMAAAETALVGALDLDPEYGPYQDAVLFVGQEWLDRGTEGLPPRPETMDEARAFYRRLAERFGNADWFNNHAFLSRELGTAVEAAGEEERARQIYEESFDSYERTIAAAPDNARYVNDTGLMLFYHLDRDPERAEQLFRRAWDLGRAVCENPFVEPAVHEENFVAYTDAMLNLARLLAQQGRAQEAAEVARELVELAPDRLDAHLTLRQIEAGLAGAKKS